jgi:hypothetical protein
VYDFAHFCERLPAPVAKFPDPRVELPQRQIPPGLFPRIAPTLALILAAQRNLHPPQMEGALVR